ncbi:phosphoribosyltransferase family protein [Pedobacter sp. NJ-S-72]
MCNKVRDVSNGKIKQITVDQDDLGGKDCFIIDDICDGGATFIGVAKELKKRNAGKVSLIVFLMASCLMEKQNLQNG